jgi:hypothetical protein
LLYGESKLKSLLTNNVGFIALNNDDIIAENGKKLYAFLRAKDMLTHTIAINNPYLAIHKSLARTPIINETVLPTTLINNAALVLDANEKSIRLNEVVIKGKNDKAFIWGANKCGDYVCLNKILNCPNHKADGRNSHPIVGKKYLTQNGIRTYRDCNDTELDGFISLMPSIWKKNFI